MVWGGEGGNAPAHANIADHGKYIIFTTYPGTDVVEKMIMEADIYSVTSDGDYLYLYIDGLRSPARVEINGNSLYTMGGGERYYIW